ncbi:MAG: hypothetical protein ABIQ18_07195 [Umezawaea sp.]
MSGRPPITPEMRSRALTLPNNWLHVVDPTRDTSQGIPADPKKAPRQHVVLRREGGEQVLDAFASPEALPRDWPPHWHRFTGVELAVVLDRLGEPVRLRLAESSDVRFDIRSDALVDALRTV